MGVWDLTTARNCDTLPSEVRVQILPIVMPYRGIRGLDGFGGGGFGAPRGRDDEGNPKTHTGLDFITISNDSIVCPFIEAEFERPGWAYNWTRDLSLVILREVGGARRTARIYYLEPRHALTAGEHLSAGNRIGHAQDLAGAYDRMVRSRAKDGDEWALEKLRIGATITNHVHLGLFAADGTPIDPTPLLALPIRE